MKSNSSHTPDKTPFKVLGQATVPTYLVGRVRERIAILEKRASAVRALTLVSVATLSFAGLVASCVYVWTTLASSGFGQYLSIIVSDSGAALAYYKELGLVLLESSPVLGLAFALITALAFAWSFAGLIKRNGVKNNYLQSSYGYSQ